jgi:hypothetical protein
MLAMYSEAVACMRHNMCAPLIPLLLHCTNLLYPARISLLAACLIFLTHVSRVWQPMSLSSVTKISCIMLYTPATHYVYRH